MGWWHETTEYVTGGFGGLFAWDKAHSITGTIAAFISIAAFSFRQFMKRRSAQRELESTTALLSEAEKEIAAKQKKLEIIEKAAHSHETHLWDLWPRETPEWFCRKWPTFSRRIITLANFKGGVGKTTISANLAIALARRGYRVLIIDLDYQGSLDGRFDIGRVDLSERSGTNALLLADGRLFDTNTLYKLSGQFSGISLVPAFYGLASLENRLMLQWLLQSCEDDIRFRIAQKLLDPEVEKLFDVVIMDTPPRLSAGTVNALCVSTDILIPTVVDSVALETVAGFAHTVQKFKQSYNFRLEILGVIPSLTPKAILSETERSMLKGLDNRLTREGFSARVLPVNVPRKTTGQVVTGAQQLYFTDDNCKQVFDTLVETLRLSPPADAIRGKHENSGVSFSA